MKRISVILLLAVFSIAPARSQDASRPIPVILDTDFGSCTDDLFSLVMLYHYAEDGLADIQGIIVDREGNRNAVLVDVFNQYYGHPDIPIALERNGVKDPQDFIPYSRLVEFRKADGDWLFPRSIDPDSLPDGHVLYRKLLSEADDNSVVVIAIGMMTCLSQLFESGADEYSPLGGLELFARKVKAVYVQAGHFEGDDQFSGYNMRTASEAAAAFYDKLPSNVELILSPTNVGKMMDYTSEQILTDLSYTSLHPIKTVYTQFDCEVGQRMWDTNCVVNAVLGDGEYHMSPRGRVRYVDRGEASQLLFTPDPEGNTRYQLPGDTYFAEEKLMDIRRHTRMNRYPSECTIEAPQEQLTGADAADWALRRLDQLTDKYMGTAGNTLDPHGVLQLFRPLGFTGTNASDFSQAELLLYDGIFDKMVSRALREGVRDLTIVMGPPSSGKSTAVRLLGLDKSGLICDGVPEGEGVLAGMIERARTQGMDRITLVPVYNDIHSCLRNSLHQGSITKQYNGLDWLIAAYRSYEGKVAAIHSEFPDIAIQPVDCSRNKGPRHAGSARALKWSYKVSPADIDRLLETLLEAVTGGEIGMSSLRAAAGDLYSIPDLTPKGRALADSINASIDQRLKEYIQR